MKMPETKRDAEETAMLVCLWAAILLAVVALCTSCSVISVKDQDHGVFTRLYVPAYPWSDVAKTVNRLSVTYRTNGLTVTLKDYGEETVGATNLAKVVEGITTGIIRGLK